MEVLRRPTPYRSIQPTMNGAPDSSGPGRGGQLHKLTVRNFASSDSEEQQTPRREERASGFNDFLANDKQDNIFLWQILHPPAPQASSSLHRTAVKGNALCMSDHEEFRYLSVAIVLLSKHTSRFACSFSSSSSSLKADGLSWLSKRSWHMQTDHC